LTELRFYIPPDFRSFLRRSSQPISWLGTESYGIKLVHEYSTTSTMIIFLVAVHSFLIFPIPLRIRGWVGLGGWLYNKMVYLWMVYLWTDTIKPSCQTMKFISQLAPS